MRPDHLLLHDTMNDRPYRIYNIDIYKYPLLKPSGLYGSVPVIISHHPSQKTVTGLFWQNCSETYMHLKKFEEKGPKSTCYWLSEAGNMEFYLWIDDNINKFFQTSSMILGQAAMPQYFNLGYHKYFLHIFKGKISVLAHVIILS